MVIGLRCSQEGEVAGSAKPVHIGMRPHGCPRQLTQLLRRRIPERSCQSRFPRWRGLRHWSSGCSVQNALTNSQAKVNQFDLPAGTRPPHEDIGWLDIPVVNPSGVGCFQGLGRLAGQMQRAADGLAQLTEYGAKNGLNIIVENHGGLSSNGEWLAAVIKKVNNPRCGTLPDFGNFNLGMGKQYDRYKGVAEMMPFAKGVSAKSHDFDDKGEETHTDYHRMLKIVLDAGYHGYVGIEYEGGKLSEPDGIRATKKLLEKVRAEMSGGK